MSPLRHESTDLPRAGAALSPSAAQTPCALRASSFHAIPSRRSARRAFRFLALVDVSRPIGNAAAARQASPIRLQYSSPWRGA
jgi:hypothetical protein